MKKYLIVAALSLTIITPLILLAESTSETMTVSTQTKATTIAPTTISGESSNVKLFPSVLRKGQKSETISDLQNILKNDPSIYPEGLVTGYYGSLTEKAVKKLQEKYNLPETGVLDEKTQQVILPPRIELKIIVPNGGETWDKSATQTILWEAKTGPVILNNQEILPESSSAPDTSKPSIAPAPLPFFTRASLDLIQDSYATDVNRPYSRRYHIATVNLYDSQYNWRIPAKIPEGDNYRVQISVGGNVPCYERYKKEKPIGELHDDLSVYCPMSYPIYSASDASDKPFSITGTTPPSPEIIAKLKAELLQMEQTVTKLLRQIQSLKSLLESL